ncbi:MAG: hypothetical protein MZV70_21315 [Desulfobacterales bacterium]|nr:hypothetical protein [Desulfobacterales bacterium]
MVLFVGRIEPLKGVDTLIHAMSLHAVEGCQPSRAPGDHRRRPVCQP